MENSIKIGVGLVVLAGVGYYFYDKNKSSMSNIINTTQSVTENLPVPTGNNNIVSSGKYNIQEATSKALITVKDWIKIYDGLSSDVLSQKSKNYAYIQKQIDDLKAKKSPSIQAISELQYLNNKLSSTQNISLKDAIKRVKDMEYSKVYNVLKELYTKYPKADVDKLMTISPKLLSAIMLGDDYQYSYDVTDGLSIDDKLYLSDINFYNDYEQIYEKQNPRNIGKTLVGIAK
jgi:hypothetical protein